MFSTFRRAPPSLLQTSKRFKSTACGIVGYPNIGKSTLFNALTNTQLAQASNYPFCTIDPNVAKVAVNDWQIKKLTEAANPEKVTPAQIEIWDIAGLIKGASEGAGLGNKFLANIRSVNCIIHLVRCFSDTNVIYSEGDVNNLDPVAEMEEVQTELILSDLEICYKRSKKKGLNAIELAIWDKVIKQLDNGKPIRLLEFNKTELPVLNTLPLITAKPVIFACNVDTEAFADHEGGMNELATNFVEYAAKEYPDSPCVILSSLLEEELIQIIAEDGEEAAREYMELSGMDQSQLDKLLEGCSNILGLMKFYTAGPTQVSSWFIKRGSTAPEAAGTIHSGFQKAFICAEQCSIDDWSQHKSEEAIRRANRYQRYGKDYEVQENDVLIFKHNLK